MKLHRHRKRISRPAAKRRARSQTKAIVHKLQHEVTSSHPASGKATAHSLTQLQTTIQAVAQDVHANGAGSHTSLVKSALGDLEHGIQALAKSFVENDSTAVLTLLATANKSIKSAESKAKRAGHDWPL